MDAYRRFVPRIIVLIVAVILAALVPVSGKARVILAIVFMLFGFFYLSGVSKLRIKRAAMWSRLENEGIILNIRKHWVALLTPACFAILTIVLLIAALVVGNKQVSGPVGLGLPQSTSTTSKSHHHKRHREKNHKIQKHHVANKTAHIPNLALPGQRHQVSSSGGLILGLLSFVSFVITFLLFINWWCSRLVLTKENLNMVRDPSPWLSFMKRKDRPWLGRVIESAHSESSGFWGNQLGYGLVMCSTNTKDEDEEIKRMTYIPDSDGVAGNIRSIIPKGPITIS
jgi:hypothetical protein